MSDSTAARHAPARFVYGFAILLLAALAYVNTFQNEFVWDDVSSVLLHESVQNPARILRLFQEDQHAYAGGQGNFYRPLLSVTFMLDYGFATGFTFEHSAGTEPSTFPFHGGSLLWHAAAAVLLWNLFLKLGASVPLATATGAIYAVHPLHTEAVAYISGRADSMAAAFMFGGLIAVLPRSNRYANIRNLVTGSLCFIAALLSKESALIFPVLAILCLLFHTPPANDSTAVSRKRILVTLAPILVILGIYAVLRSTVLDFSTDAAASSSTLSERIVESLQSLALYIQLIFRPAHLHMERTLAGATTGTTLAGTAVLLIMAATFVAAFVTRRRLIALGIGWFTATWIPISGIFPLNAPMAEHWLYVPLGGFLLALFALAEEGFVALEKRVPAPALRGVSTLAVCTFVLFLFAKTIERNRDWRDNETLYVATLRENPNTIRIHYNLAVTYSDLLGNVPGAKRHYREVLRLYREKRKTDPDLAGIRTNDELESHLSLGIMYLEENNFERAALHFQAILRRTPDNSNRDIFGVAAYNFGQTLIRTGRPAEAQEYFRLAVQLHPEIQGAL